MFESNIYKASPFAFSSNYQGIRSIFPKPINLNEDSTLFRWPSKFEDQESTRNYKISALENQLQAELRNCQAQRTELEQTANNSSDLSEEERQKISSLLAFFSERSKLIYALFESLQQSIKKISSNLT